MIKTKKYSPVYLHVGMQLRKKRLEINISQEKLGNALGISFQQIQKYEKGQDRISSSILYQISKILNVPLEYFFKDISDDTKKGLESSLAESKNLYGIISANETEEFHTETNQENTINTDKDLIELVTCYKSINNLQLKQQILALIKTLSKQ